MAQLLDIKFTRGLDINSNPLYGDYQAGDLYGGPRTALQIADECVLTRTKELGNRRGFDYFINTTTALCDQMFEFQSNLIMHNADNSLWYAALTSPNPTQFNGTYIPPTGYRMDACVGRGSLFFTATQGTMKLDTITDQPIRAGMTKGLDVRCALTGTGNGFLSGLNTAGYRITWTRTDANGQILTSDVSQRQTITNANQQTLTNLTSASGTATATTPVAHGFATGDFIVISGATPSQYNGTYAITVTSTTTFTYAVSGSPASPATTMPTAQMNLNVNVSFTVPWDVQSGDSWQVWRTVTVDAQGGADPGDTEYLVNQTLNTNAAGSTITYTDTTPDTIVEAQTALYTNATQQGITSGNERPPNCVSLCNYYDYQIYANCSLDQQQSTEMLATTNFVAGTSSITITPTTGTARTYTFNTSENVSTQQVQIFTGGISPSLNVQETSQSLCHVINGDASGSWYCEYTSSPTGNPGLMRIWARSPLSGAFWLTCNNSTTSAQFSPAIPTSGNTIISTNDARANRIFYSKFQEPDSVPLLQYQDIGRLDMPIRRVLALRDGIYIFKDDGCWYLSGLVPPFALSQLDSTCDIIGPSSAVVLNNSVFMFSNQGIVQVTSSGVTIQSVAIEPALMDAALILPNLASIAYGVANEVDRQYILWLPTLSGDTYGTQAYVFHTLLQEWTRWLKPAMCGLAPQANNRLYISSGMQDAILLQNKTNTNTDYADETLPITITGQSGLVVTATWSNTGFTPSNGLYIFQGDEDATVVTAVNTTGNTWQFTIDQVATFSNGTASVQMPIQAHFRVSPQNCGEIGIVKQFYTAAIVLDSSTSVSQCTIEIATNEASTMYEFPIVRSLASTGWGNQQWGDFVWGGQVNPASTVPYNVDVPMPDHTGETLTFGWYHNVAHEQFIMAQAFISFDTMAEYEDTD